MQPTKHEGVWTLTEGECWNLLSRRELGRLAVTTDGRPEIFPLNYVTDGPRVLFRTAPGSKLARIAKNPWVAFEVDEYDDETAASVVVKGTAKLLELQRDIDAADALPLHPWIPTLKYRWVRITPDSISGRRFRRTGEPERYAASKSARA
jgi:nitroimidazol reductase NimA-like FMN-containing flavoprotein (pyridoxamine 5'-phosphate oxidase superfamily)